MYKKSPSSQINERKDAKLRVTTLIHDYFTIIALQSTRIDTRSLYRATPAFGSVKPYQMNLLKDHIRKLFTLSACT